MGLYGTEETVSRRSRSWRWPDGVSSARSAAAASIASSVSRRLYQCNACRRQTSLTAGTIFDVDQGAADDLVPRHVPDHADQAGHLLDRTRPPARRHADDGVEDQDQARRGDADRRARATGSRPHRDGRRLSRRRARRRQDAVVAVPARSRSSWPSRPAPTGGREDQAPAHRPLQAPPREGARQAHHRAGCDRRHRWAVVLSRRRRCRMRPCRPADRHRDAAPRGIPRSNGSTPCSATSRARSSRTYRAVRKKHLVRTLAEFEWRFNNRFDLAAMIPSLGRAAITTKTGYLQLPQNG